MGGSTRLLEPGRVSPRCTSGRAATGREQAQIAAETILVQQGVVEAVAQQVEQIDTPVEPFNDLVWQPEPSRERMKRAQSPIHQQSHSIGSASSKKRRPRYRRRWSWWWTSASQRRGGVSACGTSYGYDPNGSLVSKGAAGVRYDMRRLPIQVNVGSTVLWRAAYDGEVTPRKRLDANGTIHYAAAGYEVNYGNGRVMAQTVTKYHAALGRTIPPSVLGLGQMGSGDSGRAFHRNQIMEQGANLAAGLPIDYPDEGPPGDAQGSYGSRTFTVPLGVR